MLRRLCLVFVLLAKALGAQDCICNILTKSCCAVLSAALQAADARLRRNAEMAQQPSNTAGEHPFVVGEQVEKKDTGKEWTPGYVTQLDPLKVTASYTDPAANGYQYDEVRPLEVAEEAAKKVRECFVFLSARAKQPNRLGFLALSRFMLRTRLSCCLFACIFQ
jgi:hypothetical protein